MCYLLLCKRAIITVTYFFFFRKPVLFELFAMLSIITIINNDNDNHWEVAMCGGINGAQSSAQAQPAGTTAILFHPRFRKVRVADTRSIFTHWAPLISLVSKLPFCNPLCIQKVWIHCRPFIQDLVPVHPSPYSSSGGHQLPDPPQLRGAGC